MAPNESPAITPLGHALLCEIRRQPRGGYALRRAFETTPLGIFSSSPGSIYPALKRLEAQGLLASTGAGKNSRFEITSPGIAALEAWLSQPVTVADIASDLDLVLLRFAFLQDDRRSTRAAAFLASLHEACRSRETDLKFFLGSDEGRRLPLLGRLAVDHGVRSIRATKLWAAHAADQLRTERIGEDDD